MSTSPDFSQLHRGAAPSVLVVGVGGLGCPAALALARSGVRLVLVDDDVVDESNLHRQILFEPADVGRPKLEAARDRLLAAGAPEVSLVRGRLVPDGARELVASASVVLEGADNFATKFLAADACHLERRPLVQGAAVRWGGTALLTAPGGEPCYRCLFEDLLPDSAAPNCAEAGVVGPVVGLVGALLADLALDALAGDFSRAGQVFSVDGRRDRLRASTVHARADCPLCGRAPLIDAIVESRYFAPSCAAPSRVFPAKPLSGLHSGSPPS